MGVRFEDVMSDVVKRLEKELKVREWKEVYIGLWIHNDYPNSCVDTNPVYPVYRSEHSHDVYIKSFSDIRRVNSPPTEI